MSILILTNSKKSSKNKLQIYLRNETYILALLSNISVILYLNTTEVRKAT